MKKNNRKKLLALMMALALMVGCMVGGTLAWLIATTDPVENTFVAGNINIVLQEHTVDLVTGKINSALAGTADEFTPTGNKNVKLLPGRVIDKDPTVTVLAGSEPCYVRMYMIIDYGEQADGKYVYEDTAGWFNINSSWIPGEYMIDSVNGAALGHILEFTYTDVVDASNDVVKLPALFTEITIPSNLTSEQYTSLAECSVVVVAQAVQAAGFNDAQEAFTASGRPEGIEEYVARYIDYARNEGKVGDDEKISYPVTINATNPNDNSGTNGEGGE